MTNTSFQKNWLKHNKSKLYKEHKKMKNPERNAVAKLGYTITMVVVTTAILVCIKKYKDWLYQPKV